jgi:hypothetical protein
MTSSHLCTWAAAPQRSNAVNLLASMTIWSCGMIVVRTGCLTYGSAAPATQCLADVYGVLVQCGRMSCIAMHVEEPRRQHSHHHGADGVDAMA